MARTPRRTDENAGKGSITLGLDDMRDAYRLSGSGERDKKGFIDSPLFQGISAQTKREFEEAMMRNRRAIGADEVMTRHSAEIAGPGSKTSPSPHNPLWVMDKKPIRANLYDLPDSPDAKSKTQLGATGEFEVLGLRGWFAGAVETPVAILPGLQVRSAEKQTATRIPSLAEMNIPYPDLARLMDNTAGVFSQLLATDNSAEIVNEPGYTPHQLPNLRPEEMAAFSNIPGSRKVDLDVNRGFTPPKNLAGPHAIVLSGEGVFIGNSDAMAHRGRDLSTILEAGVVPLAQVEHEVLAFQWVGLNTSKNEASAVFYPKSEGCTARYVPVHDNLTLRLLTLNSMAEAAASMHRHIGSLQANESLIKKIGRRWAGLRGLLGA